MAINLPEFRLDAFRGADDEVVKALPEIIEYLFDNMGNGGGGSYSPEVEITGQYAREVPLIAETPKPIYLAKADETITFASGSTWVDYFDVEEDPGVVSIEGTNISGVKTYLSIRDCNNIEAIRFPVLKYVGDEIDLNNNPLLETLELPQLTLVTDYFSIYDNANLTEISLPSLKVCDGLSVEDAPNCTIFSVPNLVSSTGTLRLDDVDGLLTANFPSLTHLHDDFNITHCDLIETVLLPEVTVMGAIYIYDSNPNLTTVYINPDIKEINGSVQFGCPLTEANVDDILVLLAGLDGTNGTVAYSDNYVSFVDLSAPPSAIGLAAVTTLEQRGCTVNVNS